MDTWRNKEPQDVSLTQKRIFLLETAGSSCDAICSRAMCPHASLMNAVQAKYQNVFLVAEGEGKEPSSQPGKPTVES